MPPNEIRPDKPKMYDDNKRCETNERKEITSQQEMSKLKAYFRI